MRSNHISAWRGTGDDERHGKALAMRKDMERPFTVLKLFACGASTSPRRSQRLVYRVYSIGMILILGYQTFRAFSLVRMDWTGSPKSKDILPIGFSQDNRIGLHNPAEDV